MSETIAEIRARHELAGAWNLSEFNEEDGLEAHADRATLLRLLSEERARRVEAEGALAEIARCNQYMSEADTNYEYEMRQIELCRFIKTRAPATHTRTHKMDELENQTPAQDCELEYWLQQAENYAEVQIPADDLRAIIARTYAAVNALPELRTKVKRLEAQCKALSYVHEGAVTQAREYLQEQLGAAIDPIDMSDAIGAYLEVVTRATNKDTQND